MCKVTWSLFLHFLVFATSYEFNAVYRTNQYEVAHYYEKDLYEIPWNCLFSPMHATLYNILTCSYCDNITICIAIDVQSANICRNRCYSDHVRFPICLDSPLATVDNQHGTMEILVFMLANPCHFFHGLLHLTINRFQKIWMSYRFLQSILQLLLLDII